MIALPRKSEIRSLDYLYPNTSHFVELSTNAMSNMFSKSGVRIFLQAEDNDNVQPSYSRPELDTICY